ncbi:hypothetical protein FCULG_00006204 [Fusarium culmorum]|uniref:Uncharacterized protein n=1 Tax=Fusarium culmorum TaxID=5516 RepID=A0A2T4GT71_FUSCU|nr:hypothetical protein FCULG_00006204 [Fusarium culmorum]
MPRVTHFDTDVGRLPNGMQRISYNDRTNMYTFRAADGTLWESSRSSTPPHHRAAAAFARGIPTRAATTRRPAGPSAESRPRSATTGTRPAAPRQEHQSAAPRQHQSATPRQERRSTAPARQPGTLQRTATACLTSLRRRARSVRITLTGSVSKTLEEAKAAISKI